jgi:hypothetical protein
MKHIHPIRSVTGKNPSAEGFVNISRAEYNQNMYDMLRIGGSTVFNRIHLFKHKGHDGHKGKTYKINVLFLPLCTSCPSW